MILDRTGLLSENQAITATAASTNVIDLGNPGTPYGASTPLKRDIGRGEPVPFFVGVTEAFNNLTSLTIAIQTDTTAAFSAPDTVFSATYVAADLVPGQKHIQPDWFPVGASKEFVRMFYTVTGTAPTTGRITAGVVMSRQTNSGRY
ncbi:hypothetical protein SAQ01S_07140 [Sphingomonas aquatilis NBRC 16722]|uniref:Uncharacterized protein n=1 Tax=Sphingomonas aquatilis TaxID=93063 RepID=A0AAW3TWQ7_9SPHN|nr:hypothetical protein [Sphingomonas aquatilis]MBB3876094.1 hypothetical protein [Sphingomonas aquatilis]GEM70948.1 hypothetical protein SAQ01S_07140 [Sphingomonas aquatilis NBRC 16722]